ncbi:GGDEF domain-containing protein [bacterium]|nr:GGDEF domain-containing protein [bacterium]
MSMPLYIPVCIGLATFLIAIALWEYLSIRRLLDTVEHDRLKDIRTGWRLLGIILAFMLLSNLLLLYNAVKQVIDIPIWFHSILLLVGGLFVAIVMVLFRATLANAIRSLSPGLNVEELGDAVWRDPLTGLPNRRALAHALKQEWHRSERHKRPLAVLMLDLDNFGRLVDENGNEGGDVYLCAFATFIAGQIRVVDTVARYDSDIFVIILPEEGPSTARSVAERIRKNVADFKTEIKGRKTGVTASIGVTNNTIGELESYEELLRRAEHACTAAKNGGHNRVVSFTSSGKMGS